MKSCEIDSILKVGKTFTDKSGGKTFYINHHFTCNSTNVVYLFTCVCGMQYVGSTTSPKFRLRFNKYKSDIDLYGKGRRNFKQEYLIIHFHSDGHTGSYTDISLQIIDHCNPNNKEQREDFWIHRLDTMTPNGLNTKRIVVRYSS